MNEEEQFERVCRPSFSRLEKGQEEIIRILKGKNGDPGLCDDVRQLKQRWVYIFGAIGVLFTTIIIQFVHWIFRVFT